MTTAFLDIETARDGSITVIGLQIEGLGLPLMQPVAPTITRGFLEGALPEGTRLYTFNGHSFDVPVIKERLGVDLRARCESIDLYGLTRKAGLVGGQKKVEAGLRKGSGFSAFDGPTVMWERPKPDTFVLWERWKAGDRSALEELLAYNAADCSGLIQIRDSLMARGAVPARFG